MKNFLMLGLFSLVIAAVSVASGGPHWAYEGSHGPSHWGKLEGATLCENGKQQSPVDLKWQTPKSSRELNVTYSSTAKGQVIDNGHTIQVNFEPGNSVMLDGQKFDLVQLHFHTRSEHSLSKRFFPLEMHFVHKNAEGKLAVVGVLFEEGAKNAEIEKIWSGIPSKKNEEKKLAAALDLHALLPTTTTHYHYIGSLTTPPCSEGVNWNVLNTPITLSTAQLGAFKKLYSNNYRPVQKLNDRLPANY